MAVLPFGRQLCHRIQALNAEVSRLKQADPGQAGVDSDEASAPPTGMGPV